MGENEPPAVDDVWKASAYGDLEKLTRYIDEDPALVNAQDATGYVRHAASRSSLSRCLSSRASLGDLFRSKIRRRACLDVFNQREKNSRDRALATSPPLSQTGSDPCSGPR